MMKNILIAVLMVLLGVIPAAAQLNYVGGSFKSSSSNDVKTGGSDLGNYNMTSRLVQYQPSHNDADIQSGLVRIRFKNMSNSDIKDNFKVSVGQGYFAEEYSTKEHPSPYVDNAGTLEYWFFVDPGDDMDITLTHPTLGQVRIPKVSVKSAHMYEAEIECEKRTTINFESDMEGTKIVFDNVLIGEAPVKKENVPYGRYKVSYTRGGKTYEETIEVSEAQTLFKAQMKDKCMIEFTTNLPGARFYVDDVEVGVLPLKAELTEGAHTIRALAPNGAYNEESINVTPMLKTYEVKVFKSKVVDFYAMYNNSRIQGASVFVNNEQKGLTPMSLDLPYGTYNVRMSYQGRDKKGRLDVNENSKADFSLVIPVRHRSFNPFEIDYRKREYGVAVSFIQKWYKVKYEGNSAGLDFWGDEHRMSGLRVGVPIQPLFGYGIGINTGLYCDMVFAFNDDPSLAGGEDVMLTDVSLYMPVHLLYRLPLSETFSIFVNGGIGLDIGLAQTQSADGYDDLELKYGEDGMQNRFNVAGEFGGGVQFKALQLSAGYSIGLTDNKHFFGMEGVKTTINHWDCTLSILF